MTKLGLKAALDTMRLDAQGASVLADWLGHGGEPVAKELAEQRSKTCLACQFHCEPNWWERIKSSIADAIKQHLATKTALGLTVKREKDMAMCRACGCATRLKIWCPLDHIVRRTPTDTFKKFPASCWIKQEIGQ